MEKRQIKMQDGRYLIFYTFADAPPPPASAAGESRPGAQANGEAQEQSVVVPEAEEERSV
jgi:hypothetical protein